MSLHASQQQILGQLRIERENRPDWAEVLDLQISLLEAQIEAALPAVTPVLDAQEAIRRRRQGMPLIGRRELQLDWSRFAPLFRRVCQLAAQHRRDFREAFQALEPLPHDDPGKLHSWVDRLLVEGRLAEEDDPAGLAAFVVTHALRPFIRRHAEAYASLVDEKGWKRGYCPVCGGEPDMASLGGSLHEAEGVRFLLCSRCDFEWLFPRLGCPYCESKDHAKITYYPEAEGPHRLYVCQACNRYLKTVDLRSAPGRVLLPVERILTIGMDVMAREKGYT